MRSLMLAVLLLSVAAETIIAQEDAFLVLEGGTLIDGRGGPPIEDAVIVVRGELAPLAPRSRASHAVPD